jgi:drug/metabolite transporter (DMT)-like permease
MFMGGLLLIAAVLTWGIGLWMSPHGDPVVDGVQHVRPVIVSFMLKDAIGTLILSALAAWLLFPARRPKWPARDWALISLLVFLAGTSLYILVWLQAFVPH